jgi:uncharacterized protein (DUF433 family)
MTDFPRITQDPAVMGGKPCIRGMRITVGMIVGQIGAGRTVDELLIDYPYLQRDDILEALRYAACARRNVRSNWLRIDEATNRYEHVARLGGLSCRSGIRSGSLVAYRPAKRARH